MIPMRVPWNKNLRGPYYSQWRKHKYHAAGKNVPFLLTYEEWLDIWQKSGHIHEIGTKKGQYCMARFGDKGGYEIGNVEIVTVSKNHKDRHLRFIHKKHSPETKAKMKESARKRWDKYWKITSSK